jgi:autotransporter-associated beta strand protein
MALARRTLRAVSGTLFVAAASLATTTGVPAQTPSIWNNYNNGPNGLLVSWTTPPLPGSPQITIGGPVGSSTSAFTLDTGSTGAVLSANQACGMQIVTAGCSGTPGNYNYTAPANNNLGYSFVKYASSGASPGVGVYSAGTVTIYNASGAAMAQTTVPVLITNGGTSPDFGVGFGTANNVNGAKIWTSASDAQQAFVCAGGQIPGVTCPTSGAPPATGTPLYGRTINPLMNLTMWNPSSSGTTLVAIPQNLAPGYVISKSGFYIGLSQSDTSGLGMGPSIKLSPASQLSGSATLTYAVNSQYAATATANDWMTPSMSMQISNAGASTQPSLNGQYYGTIKVDTGITNAIVLVGNTGLSAPVVTALTQSSPSAPAQIAISLAGATPSTGQQYFTYVYQGLCNSGTTNSQNQVINGGCGPEATTGKFKYSNRSDTTIIPIYPISSGDSNNTTLGNTGFEDTGPPAYNANQVYLNTGVGFLRYFDIVYDPVSGFISYIPNGSSANGEYGPFLSPVLALQGGTAQAPIVIPDGTMWNTPVFLFTAIGGDGLTTGSGPTTSCYSSNAASDVSGCAAVDVVLSTPGTVMFNQPISSDTIANCTSNCSTGLVLGGGTFFLNAQNTYTGATTVYPGATLIVNGSIASSTGSTSTTCPDMPTVALSGLTVCTGGTVGGLGTLPTTTIYGTLAPGYQIGGTAVIGTLTVQGNLTFGPGGTYQAILEPKAATHTHVIDPTTLPGTATLAGTVQAMFLPDTTDTYKRTHYVILRADGGISGTFSALSTSNLPLNFDASLSYTATDVDLDLTHHLGRDVTLARSHKSIADAISRFANNCVTTIIGSDVSGASCLPPNFQALFSLTDGALVNALAQISGEVATDAQQGAFQLGNQFLGIMLDPFVDGRSGVGGSDVPALGFAPEREPLPEDVALAYATLLKEPPKPQSVQQGWSVWGGSYGGTSRTTGDPLVVGSHDLSASAVGTTAGLDYHLTRDTVVGFALAGGGTGWSLASALGTGKSDAFQAGIYGATRWGASYVAAAFGFTDYWMSTDRIAFASDHLSASFNAQSYGGRVESGYRFGTLYGGFTPYGAIQAQSFHTPSYSETDLTSGGFGLSFNSRTAGDTRSELGARYDNQMRLDPYRVLAFRARLAWAHDSISDPTLAPVFQALPGASFIVDGATPAKNSALTSAGAELRIANGFAFLAKFDGEFSSHSTTYAGTGTVRYTW